MTSPAPRQPDRPPPRGRARPAPPRPASTSGPIRLRGPADVVATLPFHLGYQPTDSLVVIGLHGDDGNQVGFVARVDLPQDPDDADELWATIDMVVPRVLSQGAHRVLLVAYEDTPGRGSAPLSAAVRDLVRSAGVDVAERLVVRDGRFSCPDCSDPACCPPDGTAVPSPSDVPAVADYVLLGRSPLAHRDDLGSLVAPSAGEGADDPARRDCVLALGRAFQGQDGQQRQRRLRLAGRPTGDPALRAWGLAAWAGLLTETGDRGGGRAGGAHDDASDGGGGPGRETLLDGADPWSPSSPAPAPPRSGAPPALDLGVLLAASLRDVALRDLVVTWMCPGSLDLELLDDELVAAARTVLPPDPLPEARLTGRVAALCRATPEAAAAAPLTVLAHLVWWQGDGAMARTALDLALAHEPGYRLAQLLERMLDLAVSPRSRGRRSAGPTG